MDMDINVNISRGKISFSSNNSSRKSFIFSKVFMIPYYERMEIQNNNLLWSEQIKTKEIA